ncbi:MAG: protein translocase subunit SecD [Firmicutes bacterium]|nr:protein translocase subunit SecD [Bacillota bacterium]
MTFIVVAVILLTGALFGYRYVRENINYGLDINGGVYVLLEATETGEETLDRDAIERAIAIIRSRVDELGVTEPVIQPEGERRIRIELPGIEDQGRALEIIGRTARLSFVGPDGEEILTGANLVDAYFARNPAHFNEPIVVLEFDDQGAQLFAAATEEFLGEVIYIYLDDEEISAPKVRNVIPSGEAIITNLSAEEAQDLALLLRSGALPVDLQVLETRAISPTLGERSLEISIAAGAVGLALIILFMFAFYRLAGLVANISLFVYFVLVLGIMSALDATLTLPGTAALILSIGMAVDANIIIFERIKEEYRKGRALRTAIDAGFSRAFRTILDANVTTLIAAVVLFYFTTGPVRGFAVTLFIGILTSMFTAIILTRFLLRQAVVGRLIKSGAHLGVRG